MTRVNSSKYLRVRFQVLAMMSVKFLGCDAEQFGREIPMFLQTPSTKSCGITFQKMVVLICQFIPELNLISDVVSPCYHKWRDINSSTWNELSPHSSPSFLHSLIDWYCQQSCKHPQKTYSLTVYLILWLEKWWKALRWRIWFLMMQIQCDSQIWFFPPLLDTQDSFDANTLSPCQCQLYLRIKKGRYKC